MVTVDGPTSRKMFELAKKADDRGVKDLATRRTDLLPHREPAYGHGVVRLVAGDLVAGVGDAAAEQRIRTAAFHHPHLGLAFLSHDSTSRVIDSLAFRTDEPLEPNQIVFAIQPNEHVSIRLAAKVPGSGMHLRPVTLDFSYGTAFAERYAYYEDKARRGDMHVYKQVRAQDLWRKMLTMLFETGHPWITFKDACNLRSPQQHAGVVHSSNLCTEITLNTKPGEEIAVCNLGSVNLAQHVVDGALDEEKLARTIKTAVRMLDNVIDITHIFGDNVSNRLD